jgi:uncharacterized delta-60 repeat protein
MTNEFYGRKRPSWWSAAGVLLLVASALSCSGQLPTLLDTTFSTSPGASDDVFAVARMSDGQYLVAGQFTSYNGTTRGRLVRLDGGGNVDPSFFGGAGANSSIYTVAIQADGKVLIGGEFTSVHGQAKTYLARLESNGALDDGFATGITINNELRAIIVEPDGRILIAGRFTQVGGQTRNRVARLNADGSLDGTFNPGAGANDNIRSMLRLADGRILIGGLFTNYDGSPRARVARLLSNGALDSSFDPGLGADGQVRAIAMNSVGQIYLGGEFDQYDGTNRPAVVRLSVNGALDLSFNAGKFESDAVRALAVQPDGKVWIGGAFRHSDTLFGLNIGRLNTDGSVDEFFNPSCTMNDEVFALDYDGGNRLLVGGKFTRVDNRTSRRLAMLNPQSQSTFFVFEDYYLDAYENTGPGLMALRRYGVLTIPASVGMTFRNGTATAGQDFLPISGTIQFAALQTTGVAEVPILDDPFPEGTEWFEVELVHSSLPPGTTNEIRQMSIFDNEYQTTIDDSFTPDFVNGPIYATAVQPDGKVVIGGGFRYVGGCLANYFSRLNADGTVDCNFYVHSTGADGPVYSIALQTNGAIIAAGGFNYFNSKPAHSITRVHPNALEDSTFNAGVNLNGPVLATALQPDGRILIGGMFTAYGAETRTYLARLHSDGSLDSSFNPVLSTNGFVRAIRLMSNGSILVAGDFLEVNGLPRSRVARLTSTGSVDPNLNSTPGPNDSVLDLQEQPDGRIIIAGAFTQVDNQPRERLARLQATGALDETFNTGGVTGGPRVNSVALQRDGKVVIGGWFNKVGTANRPFIARVHSNGSLDTGFFPSSGANGEVHHVRVLTNDQILAAGNFTEIGGVTRLFIARLNPEPFLNRIEAIWDSSTVIESAGTADIDVRRAGFSTTTVTVQYETLADTAQVGSDIVPQSGTLTFAPLETVQTIHVPIINDGLPEAAERFRVRLSNPTGAILGTPSEPVVEIVDNDAGVELEASQLVVRENVGQAIFLVRRNSDGPETITVDFTTIAGTAVDGVDYLGTNGTLTFLPGEWTNSVIVPIHFNPEFEGRESFRFVLSNPSSGAGLGAKSETTVFIDDQDSSLEFGTMYPSWENGGAALCYVIRRGLMTEAATVRVRSDGGTATAGQDYLPVDSILTFAPGELFQYFYVTNLNDGLVEPLETIHLSLSEPTGLSILLSPAETNLVIFDNDRGIEFVAPTFFVNEFSTQAVAFVHRGDDGTNTLTVRYSTSNEGALAGADYLARSGVLTLPPSTNGYDQVEVPFIVPILPDKLLETNETIRLTLSLPGPLAALGTQNVARIVILDDERAGSLDLTYRVDPEDISPNGLYAGPIHLAAHSGQKLLVGAFQGLARLGPDGRGDPSFTVQSLFYFSPVALERPDGKILAGGSSSNDFFGGSLCLQLLETNGTQNALFNFSIREGRTAAIALQNDGRILIGGSFTTQPMTSESRSILRVLPSGAIDPTFDAGESTPVTGYYGVPSTVEAVVIQPDGRILIAGMFVTMGAQPSYKIARLLANGSLDPTFAGPPVHGDWWNPSGSYDGYFAAMALQADGRIMVGGSFTNIGGRTAYNLARYNPDGSIDPSFESPLDFAQQVTALALQPDGKLMVAAARYNGLTFRTESHVYRLLANGTVDPSFDAGEPANGSVTSLVLLPGGDIAIGGSFTEVNGIPAPLVARLKGDGLFLRAQQSVPNTVLVELFNTWPGGITVLEGSTNLIDWIFRQTNTAAGPSQQWSQPAVDRKWFYRATHTLP